ncbi:MAG: DUF1553 domain-containing protein [Pirellulaceae bacterium]|nr:DUF1553 domain-containing protein [Pirellulaceae bacterium]
MVRTAAYIGSWLLLAPALAVAQQSDHWAYQTPQRPALPELHDRQWARNPIDAFTYTRMQLHRLSPNVEADRATLLRRLTLGLTGLPPTLAELDAFLSDDRSAAYERRVEQLLDSPRYGERMATPWLDLARYADSHGYHMDAHRDMSAWRDWVINAFNDNMPFNQFTVEQLAGDLLPNATQSQIIASGFNRNNMVNFEAGALETEYLIEYAVDRTVTTSTVWFGLTIQCARCHDHKHDPFTQRDFYQLLAFFNQVPEKGIDGDQGNAVPLVRAPSERQQIQRERIVQRMADCDEQLRQREASCEADLIAWEQKLATNQSYAQPPEDMVLYVPLDKVINGVTVDRVSGDRLTVSGPTLLPQTKFDRGLLFGGDTFVEFTANANLEMETPQSLNFQHTDSFSCAAWIYPTTGDPSTILAKQSDAPKLRGYKVLIDDDHVIAGLTSDQTTSRIQTRTVKPIVRHQWQHVVVTYDGSGLVAGLQIYVAGVRQRTEAVHDDLKGSITTSKPLRIGRGAVGSPFRGVLDEVRIYPRSLSATEVGLLAGGDPVSEILAVNRSRRTQEQNDAIRTYFLRHHDKTFREFSGQRASAERALSVLDIAIPTSMVMRDADQLRPTFILSNGQYDSPTDPVSAGTPSTFLPMPADAPSNRLGLARWIVDPRHPLTARVAVNRIWQLHFGLGLVRTPEDFGTRGERPTHPQLLDWLATELVRSGWDTKHIHRLIVTSATYRQSSRGTASQWALDPTNRWLARGTRGRLSAEMIRDQVLATSGLLCEQLGGPSVFPYQPLGLWQEISYDSNEFTAQAYLQDHGAKLYRRSLYTFWKRSLPAPALATLGAPNREVCVARRQASNTPLEALVLMNETAFVEASRKLAQRVLSSGGTTDESRVAWGFRTTVGRTPTQLEQGFLLESLKKQRAVYQADIESAQQLLAVGESPWPMELDARELAAWTIVVNLMFCLDETVTTH